MHPRITTTLCLIAMNLALSGCHSAPKNEKDPFEGYNRMMFGINQGVDTVVMKPVSYVYIKMVPTPIQLGVGNFFDNMRELTTIANDILQWKWAYCAHDTSRFLINSTVGILGLFDPASALGLEHRKEDFGQTLYHWGYKESAYLILPLLGPSTVRDTIGIGVDYYGLSLWPWIDSDWKFPMLVADFIDIRARILRKESVLDVVAVDDYVFMRDAYFQHRSYLMKDEKNPNAENINDISGDVGFDEIFKSEKAAQPEAKPAETEIKAEDKTAKAAKTDKKETKVVEKSEKADKTDKTEKAETAKPAQTAEKKDKAEKAEKSETTEKTDKVVHTEPLKPEPPITTN